MITSDLVPYVGVAVGDTILASSLTMGFRHPTVLSGLTLEQSTQTTAVSPDPASLTFEAVYPAGWPLPRVGQLCQMGAKGESYYTHSFPFGGFIDSVEVTAEIPAGTLPNPSIPVPLDGWTATDGDGTALPVTRDGDRLTVEHRAPHPQNRVKFIGPEMDLSSVETFRSSALAYLAVTLAVGGPAQFGGQSISVSLEGRPAGASPTSTATTKISLYDSDSVQDPAVGALDREGVAEAGALVPFTSWYANTLNFDKSLRYRLVVSKSCAISYTADDSHIPVPAVLVAPSLYYFAGHDPSTAERESSPGRMILSRLGHRPALTRVKITATDSSGWAARARVGGQPIRSWFLSTFMEDLNHYLGDQFLFDAPVYSSGNPELGPVDVDSQSPWDIQQRVCAALGTVAYPDPDVYGAMFDTYGGAGADLADPAMKPRIRLYVDPGAGRNTLPLIALWDTKSKRLVAGPADETVAARIPASQVMLGYRSEDNSGITNQISVTIRRSAPDETIGATDETLTYENPDSQRRWGPSSLSIDTLLYLGAGASDAALDARMEALVTAQSEPQARLSVPITLVKRDAPFPDALANYLGQAAIGRSLTVSGAPEWFGESRLVTSTKATLGVSASLELETEPAGYNGAVGVSFDQLADVLGTSDRTYHYTANFAGCELTANDLRGIGPSVIN